MTTINDISKRHIVNQRDALNDITQNMFKNNSLFACAQKIGKITTAVHLVADVIDPTNALAGSLRATSLDILDYAYSMARFKEASTVMNLERMIMDMHYVISLVTTGKISHQISEMNAAVITNECGKVIEALQVIVTEKQSQEFNFMSPQARQYQGPVLTHELLDDALFDQVSAQSKRHQFIKTTLTTPINDTRDNVVYKQNQNDIKSKSEPVKTTSEKPLYKNVIKSATERRRDIIQVITSHKNATMQDIGQFVTDCSDKTLQREIAALIASGVIIKKGDKRWATYHIKNTA